MRTVVIDLSDANRAGADRFLAIVADLASKRRPDARYAGHCVEIATSDGADRLHVPSDLLRHPEARRTTRATAAIARAFARDLAGAETRFGGVQATGHRAAEDAAWDRLELLVRCVAPDFVERRIHAHPGTPWAPARCVDGDGGTVLPPAVVEHVCRDAPVVLRPYASTPRTGSSGFSNASPPATRWDFADSGPLAFEDRPLDPVAAIRAWRDLPDELRRAA